MITWNIDLTLYTFDQIEQLAFAIESLDYAIYKELANYLTEKNYW